MNLTERRHLIFFNNLHFQVQWFKKKNKTFKIKIKKIDVWNTAAGVPGYANTLPLKYETPVQKKKKKEGKIRHKHHGRVNYLYTLLLLLSTKRSWLWNHLNPIAASICSQTQGENIIYIFYIKKTPHWSTVAMATPARAERLHKAMDVTAMWSSYSESVCGPQCREPQQEAAQLGREGSWLWSTGHVGGSAAFWSWDQRSCWWRSCWAVLLNGVELTDPQLTDPQLARPRAHPRTAVVLNPQWWTQTTESLFPPSPASLIWPCFILVTVLPICCLLALISQTASATAAVTAVRFISCSICGCVISPLKKKKPLSLLELPEDKLVVSAINPESQKQQQQQKVKL